MPKNVPKLKRKCKRVEPKDYVDDKEIIYKLGKWLKSEEKTLKENAKVCVSD